jgi:hypothetical protein
MGHEIVYCDRCQIRIHGTEFSKGKAFDYGSGFCCRDCVPHLLKTLPLADRERLQAVVNRPPPEPRPDLSSSSTAVRHIRNATDRFPLAEDRGPGTRRLAATTRARSPALAVGVGLGALGLLLLAALFIVSRKPLPPAPPETSASAPSTSRTEAPAVARDGLLRDARDYARRQPGDLDGQIQRWEKAVWSCEGTPLLADAKAGLAAVRAKRQEEAARELALLEAQLRPLLEREAYGPALEQLERARRRFAHPDWTLPIERKVDQIRSDAAGRFAVLREDVLRARERKADGELRAASERVGRWGLAPYVDRFNELLATPSAPAPETPAAPPPPPAKADRYGPIWEKAMGLAALRDYAGAAKDLASALDASPEAAADLELLKQAGLIPSEAREAIGRWSRGQKQAVDVLDPSGRAVRLEAPYLRVDDVRLVFGSAEDPQAIEIGELSPSTLAALFLARPKKVEGDERAAVAFCLIEGDVEGAGKFQGPKGAVAGKYWDWGRKVSSERAGGREAEARVIFASAEEAWDDPARTAAAVAPCKDLLARFGDTAFVARNRASITARTLGGRDCLLSPDQLAGAGSFRLVKSPKMDTAWTVERDGDGSYVEAVFTALPETDYRGWIYAGACCLETFEFGVQATGLRAPDPKNPKDGVPAEPGAPGRVVPKIPFFLRKTHAGHGGPKTASRWDWVPLPSLRFAEGGSKTVRILSAQQGFSVGYVVLSATPDFTPKLADLKERERSRASRRLVSPPPPAGLVGHWTFDDGQGASAADASPRGHHGAVSGAAWTQGRFGGGLRFDGDNSYVELPSTPTLDGLQNGDYTLSAWFKPETLPSGKDPQNDAHYGIVMKAGMHIGLTYNNPGQFSCGHYYQSDEAGMGAGTSRPAPPGVFYHVAATYSRATGTMQIYLNGRISGSGAGSPQRPARDFGTERWRIGIAAPGAGMYRWTARGVIDEVRLYERALNAWEIRALADVRPATAPAADARPWTSFPLEKLVGPGFRMDNGVLAKIPSVDGAGRTPIDFGDAELRIRWEQASSTYIFFCARQCAEGAYTAQWGKYDLDRMKGEHELIFVCKGDAVTATLDGRPTPIERWGTGQPRTGALQFNATLGGELRIKSIETRDVR